ncbi:MAG: hypothetical protein M3Y30_13795 [Gemmatimonadota bacterium]|nr:hypothetical protein [Gemmatimonadota bacterium]
MLHTRASALHHSSRAARNFVTAMAGATLLAMLAACGSDNSTSPHALATITVTPANPTLMAGSTQQFTAVGTDASGNVVAITPTWGLSGGAGTIDGNGMFTAGATTGTFTRAITATSGGVSGSTSVTITAAAPSVVGDYTLQSIDGKAPPDTVVHTSTATVVFLDGVLALHTDMSYKLLFHSATTTSGSGTVADSSGSIGTYTVNGTTVVIHNGTGGDSVVATTALPNISFTDGGEAFVFTRAP